VIARGTASAILVGALLLGTTGCSLFSEKATLIQYSPSDGVAANVGDVDLRNVMAFSEDGEELSLVFTAINTGEDAVFVEFQFTDADDEKQTERLYVAGNSSKSVGGLDDEQQVILSNAGATVGGLFPVYAQFGEETGKQLQVPVLNESLPEYAGLIPTPSATPAE
jgi:hypothetical protein